MSDDQQISNLIADEAEEPVVDGILCTAPLVSVQHRKLYIAAIIFYTFILIQNFAGSFSLDFEEFSLWDFFFSVLIIAPYLYFFSRAGILNSTVIPPILLKLQGIELPRKPNGTRSVFVEYDDILGVDVRGSGTSRFLVIETRHFTNQFPISAFMNPAHLELISEMIIDKIISSNPERAGMFLARKQISNEYLRIVPKATICISIALIAGYIIQLYLTGGALYRLPGIGANSALFLQQGEWFPLLSSSFLHSGLLHLLFNLAGLAALGYIIEGILGTSRFIAIYTVSLFLGSLFSAVHGNLLSVGASAALFGLLGAYFYLHIFASRHLPIGFVMSLRWWLGIAFINIGIAILIPRVDFAAHCGGFLGGIITIAILTARSLPFSNILLNLRKPSFTSNFIAALCTLAFILSFIELKTQYSNVDSRSERNVLVMRAMVSTPGLSPIELNMFAWEIAIDRHASKNMIALALRAARDATILSNSPNISDTYATVLYRVGRFDSAIAIEAPLALRAKNEIDRRIFTSQLVRFLSARRSHTNHGDSIVLANQESYTTESMLDRISTHSTGKTKVLLGITDSEKKVVIIYKGGAEVNSPELIKEIHRYKTIQFIGSIIEELNNSDFMTIDFLEEVNSYAEFNPAAYEAQLEYLPFEIPEIADNQLII